MTRLQSILERARDTLADPNKERWSDPRLLRLADEAQKTIALHARVLRDTIVVDPVYGKEIYDLPTDTQRFTRVVKCNLDDDESRPDLPLISHEYADKHLGLGWEGHLGDNVTAIVFDKNNTQQFKVYPRLTVPVRLDEATIPAKAIIEWSAELIRLLSELPVYGTVIAAQGIVFEELWGIPGTIYSTEPTVFQPTFGIISIGLDSLSPEALNTLPYGVTVAIEDLDLVPTFGVVTDFAAPDMAVKFDQLFGVLSWWEDLVNDYGLWGVVTGATDEVDDFSILPLDGVLTAMFDGQEDYEVIPLEGVTTNFSCNQNAPESLMVYYQKQPATIESEEAELEVDPAFDKAIKFYITGMALRDDKDVQNRSIGNEELQLFQIELKQAMEQGFMDGTASNTQYRAEYTTGFDPI